MKEIKQKMAKYLAQKNVKNRNDLYISMLPKLEIWIKSVLKKWKKWETEGEILSLAWDIFMFALKDFKDEDFEIAGHFYTWTAHYLQNRYGMIEPAYLLFDDMDDISFSQGLVGVDPERRLIAKETLQRVGSFANEMKIDIFTEYRSPTSQLSIASLALYSEVIELAPYVRQPDKKYVWTTYTCNPKFFSIAENCDGFLIKDTILPYGVTHGASIVPQLIHCGFYELHNKVDKRMERKIHESEIIQELIAEGRVTESGVVNIFTKKAKGRIRK